jgi:hypothetical protein
VNDDQNTLKQEKNKEGEDEEPLFMKYFKNEMGNMNYTD